VDYQVQLVILEYQAFLVALDHQVQLVELDQQEFLAILVLKAYLVGLDKLEFMDHQDLLVRLAQQGNKVLLVQLESLVW